MISNYNISYFSIKLNKELNRLDAVKKININIKKGKTRVLFLPYKTDSLETNLILMLFCRGSHLLKAVFFNLFMFTAPCKTEKNLAAPLPG